MPQHHPSAETRRDFARAELGAGAALLVASHLEGCERCARALEAESKGGFKVDEAARAIPGDDRPGRGVPFPVAMTGYKVGRWRWVGPGARSADLLGAAGLGEQVYLLKARAGQKLARHGHPGREWVLVLKGAYQDGERQYEAGDVSERCADDVHGLKVSQTGECLCLVVNDGPPQLFGLARLLGPFLRL